MIVKRLICDSCGRVISEGIFHISFHQSAKGKGKGKHTKQRQFDYHQECWESILQRVSNEAKDALNKSATFEHGES